MKSASLRQINNGSCVEVVATELELTAARVEGTSHSSPSMSMPLLQRHTPVKAAASGVISGGMGQHSSYAAQSLQCLQYVALEGSSM